MIAIFPMAVGKFPPNPLGLYGMTGSVYQWVKNWYYLYSTKPVTDPQGPKTGTDKAVRGGGGDAASPGFYGLYATPHKSQVNRFVLQQLDN